MNFKRDLQEEIESAIIQSVNSAKHKIKELKKTDKNQLIASCIDEYKSNFLSKFDLIGPAKLDYKNIYIDEARNYLGNFRYSTSSSTIVVTEIRYSISYFANSNAFKKNISQFVPRNFVIESDKLKIFLEGKADNESLKKTKLDLDNFLNKFELIKEEINQEVEKNEKNIEAQIIPLLEEQDDKENSENFFNSL